MKIVYMGTPDFAVAPLQALLRAGHEILCVISQPDRPAGRKMELRPTAVKAAALAAGLPVWQPERIREAACLEKLSAMAPELIVVTAYGQLLPREVLELPRYGCLNVHASLLPAYRGAAPIQWAVINRDRVSGVSIMQMDEGLDTGAVLARREVVLAPDETGGSLFDRLSEAGAELLAETVAALPSGRLTAEEQPAESPTAYARMLTRADGELDWRMEAGRLEALIRGLDPWPSAGTRLHGKKLKVWKAAVCGTESGMSPGTVTAAGPEGILVQTGKGQLLLTEVQPEGKKRMKAADFLRGHPLKAGDRMEQGC